LRSRADLNLDVESQLAAGVDPVVLVNQSFEPEPIRLRVIAKDAAERDALSRQFTAQLADTRTENLARRSQNGPRQNQPAGAFYLEGKPGVNFADSRETQILVRLPADQAQIVVDQVASNVAMPADQLNFRAGAVSVKGVEKSRQMVQLLAGKDKDDARRPRENFVDAAAPPARSGSKGLVDTLGEIVGLGAIVNQPIAKTDTTPSEAAASSERLAMAEREAGHSGDRDDALDKKESKEKSSTSLVDRRLEEARSARSKRDETGDVNRTQPAAEGSNDASASSRFITMVVEFVLPVPKTPPNNGHNNRSRS